MSIPLNNFLWGFFVYFENLIILCYQTLYLFSRMKNFEVMQRLLTLGYETVHPIFDFNKFNSELHALDPRDGHIFPRKKIEGCGTVGCLAGELPGITKDWSFVV